LFAREEEMSPWKAGRDGAIIAACVMAIRFVVGSVFEWPAYSWPEIGCLIVFANILRLGESVFIHILAPSVCYTLAGGIVGGLVWLIPPMKEVRPPIFRRILIALLSILILVPIIAFQISEWL
jgi:hypothetical protein